jgi:hypothetical protein
MLWMMPAGDQGKAGDAMASLRSTLLAHRSKRRLQPEFGKIDAKQKARVLAHARSECVSALAACCMSVWTPLQAAATIAIDGDEPRERITVTLRDTSIGAALRDIGRTYGFEIKGALADGAESVSMTISGNLEDVLARLLRNVNHVIVRSPARRSGIEKVIIMRGGAAPQPGASPGVADDGQPHAERPSYPPPKED